MGISTPALLPLLQGCLTSVIHGSEGSLRGATRGREKDGEVQIQRKKHKFIINGLYMIRSLHGNHQLQVAKETPKQNQISTNKSKPWEKKKFLRRTTAQDHAAWETSVRQKKAGYIALLNVQMLHEQMLMPSCGCEVGRDL